MPVGLGFFSSRWAACMNVGEYDIPAHAVVEIDGVEHGGGGPHASPVVFKVKRPTADNKTPLAVNGPLTIPAATSASYPRGYVIFDGLATVSYFGTMTAMNLGTTANSFSPLEEGIGMRVLDYDADYNQVLVSLSSPDFGNLQVVTQPKYAICLDSDGCLCKTPVNTC